MAARPSDEYKSHGSLTVANRPIWSFIYYYMACHVNHLFLIKVTKQKRGPGSRFAGCRQRVGRMLWDILSIRPDLQLSAHGVAVAVEGGGVMKGIDGIFGRYGMVGIEDRGGKGKFGIVGNVGKDGAVGMVGTVGYGGAWRSRRFIAPEHIWLLIRTTIAAIKARKKWVEEAMIRLRLSCSSLFMGRVGWVGQGTIISVTVRHGMGGAFHHSLLHQVHTRQAQALDQRNRPQGDDFHKTGYKHQAKCVETRGSQLQNGPEGYLWSTRQSDLLILLSRECTQVGWWEQSTWRRHYSSQQQQKQNTVAL
ncbi:hypothetical protein SAY86_003477 [Trapa natans]|uniref:Uncharacterized protein n=1 Tax=Trapa natans TaxID=22666 RepID=A0AAN7RHZ2_TRANT|nr:hypothetical protein SAY86_003477 [Trapa natans]